MDGLRNFKITEIFHKVDNKDLNQNFIGVFPSDKMNRFFDFKRMMKGKKYPFLIANTDRSDKKVCIDGKKKTFYCLILLE